MAPRPGQLRQAADDAEQEAGDPVGRRSAEQRAVAAVVQERETAGQEEHQQGDQRRQQQGRMPLAPDRQPPEQPVGDQRVGQLPEGGAVTAGQERPEQDIPALQGGVVGRGEIFSGRGTCWVQGRLIQMG